MATPDNYMVEQQKKRMRMRGGMAGAPSFAQGPADLGRPMGDPRFRMPSAPAVPGPPTPESAPSYGPSTRTISAVPVGSTELDVKRAVRDKMGMRRRAVLGALNTNDPEQRAALIGERRDLEADIRPLEASLPRTTVTPDGAQASREHMRVQLARARADQAMEAANAPAPVDPALAAGTRIAAGDPAMTTPMANPGDEARRMAFLRLRARDPVLEGTGTGMQVTSPAEQEAERRRIAMRPPRPQTPVEEVFPDITAQDRRDIDNRFEAAGAQQRSDAAGAGGVLDRGRAEREMRARLRAGEMRLAEAEQSRAIEGTDAGSLAAKTANLRAQTEYEKARLASGGEIQEAQRTQPTVANAQANNAVGRLKTVLPGLANPGFLGTSSEGERQAAEMMFQELEAAIPSLNPAQKAEYANQLREIMVALVQNKSSNISGGKLSNERYVQRIQGVLSLLGQQ